MDNWGEGFINQVIDKKNKMDNIEKKLSELKEVHMDNQFVAPGEATKLDGEYSLVDKPKHYMVAGVEAIDIIEDVTYNLKGVQAVCLGNALKYLIRCTKKGKLLEDVKKAQVYLKRFEDSCEETI